MTFEQEMFNSLTDEIEQLRVDLNEAFIDGADERAKIVAWLRDKTFLVDIANEIEAGEHLK